ncbi:LuxR C-terminal-related transcriptional regulator [Streptomyces monticola]|uniref:LuxR C-terminal-related transcriptional regulator n=1 Tax=Streptomyces monticola TaxID=2666263 RepID=A0ABW2JJP0_9ACTN
MRALTDGRIARAEAREARCLIELGLLHPDPGDKEWLLPVGTGEVMAQLLRVMEEDLAAVRRRAAAMAETAERFMAVEARDVPASDAVRVLEGPARIDAVVRAAARECGAEFLSVRGGGARREHPLELALPGALDLRRRGVRTRTISHHAARHGHGASGSPDRLGDMVEARTLDEVIDRTMIFDRKVAFVSGSPDHTTVLEIRQPELIRYLVTVFDRLWRLATPLSEPLGAPGDIEGLTHRERAIAALLAEGHNDTEVAERLGINVRTCRHHISKLAEALGSSSRAQLGVRIAQAGLDVPPRG